MKKYQRPFVSTIEIPERTAYACNISGGHSDGCPHISNVVGHAICKDTNHIQIPGLGSMNVCV